MEMRQPSPRIGVMGPSFCSPETYSLAREVGFHIGRRGAVLICGGGGGVMEASARGAKEANGTTIGILPGESAAEANPYIDIPIVTGLGNARNAINVLTSQAIIAVDGSYGTLSEIAIALKCNIPVVGLKTWRLIPPGEKSPQIILANSAEEAVSMAMRSAGLLPTNHGA
jgi:uncharacterized protein (TIGR00725 family)